MEISTGVHGGGGREPNMSVSFQAWTSHTLRPASVGKTVHLTASFLLMVVEPDRVGLVGDHLVL